MRRRGGAESHPARSHPRNYLLIPFRLLLSVGTAAVEGSQVVGGEIAVMMMNLGIKEYDGRMIFDVIIKSFSYQVLS